MMGIIYHRGWIISSDDLRVDCSGDDAKIMTWLLWGSGDNLKVETWYIVCNYFMALSL